MTLQQIGEIIGVTRMRVCQLEKRILDDIRHDKDIRRAN
jgi:DNA-directed RNA polymerase specialized sigma subunit